MKRILFIRHAKSSWGNISLSDQDRPLNDRGKRDAPIMAKRCLEYGLPIDLIISSPANRALTTARVFHEVYDLPADIQQVDNLYHGDVSDYEEALMSVDDKYDSVAIFGHNPGLTYLVNDLNNVRYIDNVPTSGVVVSESDIVSWEDFSIGDSVFKDFLYPKQSK